MAKRASEGKRGPAWPLVWLIQAIAALALGALTALSLWLGGFVHGAFLWCVAPLGGAAAAYVAVRRGLNNYLAWLAPPLMELLGNLLVWGYPPSAGPVFLCGFIALVGAAAGEVRNRQGSDK